MYQFRNDYSVSAHPAVLEALGAVSGEYFIGYGEDPLCARAADLIRQAARIPDAEVQFFVGGTQANLTALAAFLRPWEGVIAPQIGHINVHEAGSVEATGHKIIPAAAGPDGKLTPDLLAPILREHGHSHMVLPRLVYISQATESGMVYTRAELTALSRYCRENDLLLFIDGARLGAALTSPACDLTLPELAALADAFYIGGTKNGALFGEALVIVNAALRPYFFRLKKQRGAVLAKGWLLGAQFQALFTDDLYFQIARHTNEMAVLLADGLRALGWPFLVDSPTNQLFPIVDNALLPRLDALCTYEVWEPLDDTRTVIRFVTNFATRRADVEGFLSALASL